MSKIKESIPITPRDATEHFEVRLNLAWIIQEYWLSILKALIEKDDKRYYNLIVGGLDPLLVPIFDKLYLDEKKALEALESKTKEKSKVWKKTGSRAERVLDESVASNIKFEYARRLYTQIQRLLDRADMFPARISSEDIGKPDDLNVDSDKKGRVETEQV